MNITISDIAQKLNISSATVSRALNNHPAISDETKKKVKKTAARLHYRKNNIASSLRSGQTGLIGVIIPSAEINFFGSVVHGIESIANENGFNVLIYQSNESYEQEKKGIEALLKARVDGIMVSIAKETTDYSHFLQAKKAGIPVVFFDRVSDSIEADSVAIDDYTGAFLATSHLAEQGYKTIAHISGPQHISIFKSRLEGYMAALKAHKLTFNKQFIYEGDVSIEAGRKAIRHFLQLKITPDAVFAVEDFTALGAIKELKEHHINPPREFGVMGFANESFGEHITPSLSTIDQQTVNMGKEAITLILGLVNKKNKKSKEIQKIVLAPIPVFRESSLRNKKTK